MRFKSSTNRAPRESTDGTLGEEISIRLELRVIADVGLLGLPNAGKSSLLRQVSAATPKVADYAFTTTKPHVGVVTFNRFDSFVMADIPGLIAGASTGHGMGDIFLKHLMRCRILLHIVDLSQDVDQQIATIKEEISTYGHGLTEKPCWVVLNKSDLISEEEIALIRDHLSEQLSAPIYVISAFKGAGCSDLMADLGQFIQSLDR